MQPDEEYLTDGLPLEWAGVARETLESRGIKVDLYRDKMVKERLLDGMARPNIDVLLKFSRRRPDVKREVAKRLHLNPRTLERWEEKAASPHARNFFGILYVGLQRELADAGIVYPESRSAIEDAVLSTVRMIRRKDVGPAGKDESAPRLCRDSLQIVRSLMRHPRAGSVARLFSDEAHPADRLEFDKILGHLIWVPGAHGHDPAEKLKRLKFAVAAIRHWAVAYSLFRFGLPDGMSFILEVFDEDPT